MADLRELRGEIEAIDDELVDVLARRAAIVRRIWAHKDAYELPRVDVSREAAEIDRLLARASVAGLDRDAVRAILERIVGHDLSGR